MNYVWPVAGKFFVTSGKASGETPKGTMHEALIKAKIQQCNLDPKSSVLFYDAAQIEIPEIPHSSLVDCVYAAEQGMKGETIGAGIAWAHMTNKDGTVKKAYVVEDHGHKEERAVEETLMYSLVQMAEAEGLNIHNKENGERLPNRRDWLVEQQKSGKSFDALRGAEEDYLKFLRREGPKFIPRKVEGYDRIPEEFGYVATALVFVFET